MSKLIQFLLTMILCLAIFGIILVLALGFAKLADITGTLISMIIMISITSIITAFFVVWND